ncbi:MAG: carbon-nitrogen hydrolase family protein [Sulfolobales archaeon]
MSRALRVGILQFGSSPSKRANLEKVFLLIKKVEADIVVLPEYSMLALSGRTPEEVYGESENLEGPYISEFKRFAKEFSTHVLVTFFEKAEYPRVYNTAVVLSPREEVIAVYRKLHLFDSLGYRESEYVTPGNAPSRVFEVRSCRAAVAVCFDLRFPEVFRYYALLGAEVVFVPSAWYSGPLKEETLEFLSRSRASENVYYVVVANQFGPTFTGRSMVVDPLGVVLLDLGIGEKYAEYEIDVDYVHEARRILPLLSLRREDVYSLKFNFG